MTDDAERRSVWDRYMAASMMRERDVESCAHRADSGLTERDKRFPPIPGPMKPSPLTQEEMDALSRDWQTATHLGRTAEREHIAARAEEHADREQQSARESEGAWGRDRHEYAAAALRQFANRLRQVIP